MEKKIGVFFGLSNYGGVQTCVISLIRGLNTLGIIPYLITDEPLNHKIIKEYDLKLELLNVNFSISQKTRRIIYPKVKGTINLFHFYKTSWLKEKMDFYYVFSPNIIVNDPTPHLYYLSMPPRDPFFFGNSWKSKLKMGLYDRLLKYFIPVYELHGEKTDFVINSKFTADLFFRSYGWNIKVVYPSNLVQPDLTIDYGIKNLTVFLSRIVPAKRPEMFIELAARHPKQDFIMIGSQEDKFYIKKLKEIVLKKSLKNIRIETNVSYLETIEYLKKAKYYVFPALYEHFGITTVEAMMHGAIPFVHNSGGQKEIVIWEDLRFEDVEFFEKFERLLKLSPDKTTGLRKEIEYHIQNFSEEKYLTEMLSYLPSNNKT